MYSIPRIRVELVREKGNSIKSDVNVINGPGDIAAIFEYLQSKDREQIDILCLSTKNKVIAIHTVSIGSLNSSIVHPREVFKAAILANSASIILVHNHPSGDPTPSDEDIKITKRLCEAGKILGITVLDHVIIGDGRFESLVGLGFI